MAKFRMVVRVPDQYELSYVEVQEAFESYLNDEVYVVIVEEVD